MQPSFVIHLLGLVLWLGALLMLSRIMVIHTKEAPAVRPPFSRLEKKIDLFAWIGMLLTIGSGLYQLIGLWPEGGFRAAHWMHHKLTLVICLVVVHVLLTRKRISWQREQGDGPLNRTLPMVAHSLTGLFLIGILCLVYLGTPHFLHVAAR